MEIPTPNQSEADAPDRPKGSPWLRELYEYFAPVREEVLASGMTEQEVNDLIDEALRDYREGRP